MLGIDSTSFSAACAPVAAAAAAAPRTRCPSPARANPPPSAAPPLPKSPFFWLAASIPLVWVYPAQTDGLRQWEVGLRATYVVRHCIVLLSYIMIALGYGGHQPTLATFGADQFNDSNPKQKDSKAAFLCYFYFALNAGSVLSNSVLVYFEDNGLWTFGFYVAAGSAFLALIFVLFLYLMNELICGYILIG